MNLNIIQISKKELSKSMTYKLGAHVSISGGYHKALERVVKMGGNCLQIFSSSPRSWNLTNFQYQKVKKMSGGAVDPIYFHATYLINLADDSRIGHLSKQSLINELNLASQLGVKGSIIHLGSYKNFQSPIFNFQSNPKYQILLKNIKEILDKTPKNVLFIIENSGNRKIGQILEEISQIIKDIDNNRVRLCLDTCHLFSNAYKFTNIKELDLFLDKLDQLKLLDRLEVWHINDSRDEFNSGHDRHENIGEGTIDLDEFRVLLNHPKTKNYPFIIETPGFDGNGPDKKNIDILKSLIKK